MSDTVVSTEGVMGTTPIREEPNVLISDEQRVTLQWMIFTGLLTPISSFGITSNIVNIICFVRQGFRDSVNVSLLGLAISDLGCLLMSLCAAIWYSPALEMLDLPVEIVDFLYLAFAPPLYLFTGLTSLLTALITLERCLCITIPIKVKSIITPKRAAVVIFSIFIFLVCTMSPVYFASELSWVFSPQRNRTILALVYYGDRASVEQFSYSVNNALIPFTAYFTIIICTFILVVKLRSKTKWRMSCTASVSADTTSRRDQRVAQMILMISIIFIVCFTPFCLSVMSMIAVPELALDGPNQNVLYVFGGISLVLGSANSSANILVYYHMSSRYRSTLRIIVGCKKYQTVS